jgi:phosphoribosylformylglycinamidine cyclo-ligase
MGSNGLTSARHDVFKKELAALYPESFAPEVDSSLVYTGSYGLTDSVAGSPLDAGRLVLSPTRTYAPVVKELLSTHRSAVHGMVHCSGGGQTKVLHFVEGVHVVKDQLFPVPVLFETIQKESGTPWNEMYQVFNMGHRMEIYLAPEDAPAALAAAHKFGIAAQIVGRVEEAPAGAKASLELRTPHGNFSYGG